MSETKKHEAEPEATGNGHDTANRLRNVKSTRKDDAKEALTITPLKEAVITVPIIGETPLKILRFSEKKQKELAGRHEAGDQARTKRKREPKDFERDYEEAKYFCEQKDGKKIIRWLGVNASGFRNGCIETCRVAGFAMTKAKMSIVCLEDGRDVLDRTPLVRVYGDPSMTVDPVRNASGVIDLRARVMFEEWKMLVRLRFDEGQFSPSDIINLMVRVGHQNGIGEGRPNSKNGNGTGNGIFLIDVKNVSLERLPQVPIEFRE